MKRWSARRKAGHVTGGKVFGYDNVKVDGHVERRINEPQAAVIRRIFERRAAGWGYTDIAKHLNAERAIAPSSQQGRPSAWGRSSVYEVLHRSLYRGELIWNKTKKRNAEGAVAVTARASSDWLRVDRPELRIVAEEVWLAAHQRIDAARRQYDQLTRGQRRPHRDHDSKYLLTGFARCALCGGGLHVRSRSHGDRRAFFYACTSHYNRGPSVCSHVDQWPMAEIDHEVLATIAGEVLTPHLADAIIAAARTMFEASAEPDRQQQLSRELARVERERARLTEAVATGDAAIPVLVERLRATERKRLELVTQIQQAHPASQKPVWREIERGVRRHLTDWRSLLVGDVAKARQAFRQLLTTPIRFTPVVERGCRALRFDGLCDLQVFFGGMVTKVASPTDSRLCGIPRWMD